MKQGVFWGLSDAPGAALIMDELSQSQTDDVQAIGAFSDSTKNKSSTSLPETAALFLFSKTTTWLLSHAKRQSEF